jgi:hypothetical protein
MTTTPDLTPPEQLLQLIADAQAFIKTTQSHIDDYKLQLQQHRDAGNITDSFSHHGITATLTERKGNWSYSSAVADLQTLEQAEGIATRKPSTFFWSIRSTPN